MPDPQLSIQLTSLDLRKLTRSGEVRDALEKACQITERAAKDHAPVDTGNLRRSIYHEVSLELQWVGRVGTNVKYGLFQELGTIHHPAHPFLRPALNELRARLSSGRL
jgi:HK97 gp10 family phage protein